MAVEREEVRIDGLHCIDCVKSIEKRISRLPGVQRIEISYTAGKMEVEYDPEKIRLEKIQSNIKRLGYGILREEMGNERVFSLANREFILALLSGSFLGIGLLIDFTFSDIMILDLSFWQVMMFEVLYLGAIALGGYYPVRRALTAIANRSFVIDGLMVIGALGAVFINAFAEGAAVLCLFSIAELLEDYSVERTRDSLKALTSLKPKMVNVRRGDLFAPVRVENVEVGDIVLVKPGQRVGVDGMVVVGNSTINQAAITGESLPVPKDVGDEVFAGTMNIEGRLEINVTKKSSDTTLSRIIQLVESAADKKSETARFIDRFSRYYTPAVLFMALAVATIPTILLNQPFDEWFYKALLLLLISCPCALAISTPISMASSITGAARRGVLIKGGLYLEELDSVNAIAFDKTGTLTEGAITVTDVIGLNGHSREDVLRVAASLECLSGHPIGLAITEAAERSGLSLECIESFESTPGRGLKGRMEDEWFFVGSSEMLDDSLNPIVTEKKSVLERQGKTTVLVGRETEIIGLIGLGDRIRDSAKEMIASLRRANHHELLMLTGDNPIVAEAVARQIGIGEFHAGLLPEEKVSAIQTLSRSGKKVAMIGDGVNDAPALVASDVGVAMGAAGSDTAIEVADVALMSDDLSKVPYLLRLGKKTMRIVKSNIAVAIAVKLLFTILVFPGLVTLWMAVAIGDMGVSLAVILNALRLSKAN